MVGLWRSYRALMTRHPWTFQIITVLERRGLTNHNVTRMAKMMRIGFFFVGTVLGGWYKVLDKLVTGGTKSASIKKMLVGFAPCFLGAFLGISRTLNGLTYEPLYTSSMCSALFQLWPPVQIANFFSSHCTIGKAQGWLVTLAVVQIVTVAWNSYMSWKANNGCFRSRPTSHI
uniref:Mitochondrial inner membrane protein Mpv17 n=1 Tax=Oncorhynchus mykiss TaxID=8022 RepID=A0A8C7QMW0_ONCMY